MRTFLKVTTALFATLLSLNVSAQQDPQFSHYMFTNMYYNAAAAGMDPYSSVSLIHRSQWLAYQTNNNDPGGAPTTQNITINHGLRYGGNSNRAGIGLSLTNDKLGPLSNMSVKLAYSHHVDLGPGKLGLGLKVGFWNSTLRSGLLRPSQNNDPIIDQMGGANVSQLKPDFGGGLWFKEKLDKYYVGIGLNHFVQQDFDFGVDPDSIDTKLGQHLYITGGYNLELNNNITIKPSFIVQSDINKTDFNIGALGIYDTKVKNEYWLGVTFRQSITDKAIDVGGKQWLLDDFVAILGFSTLKDKGGKYNTLRISYAFDLITNAAKAKNPTSHEILLTYILPSGLLGGKPPLKTPRYDHEK